MKFVFDDVNDMLNFVFNTFIVLKDEDFVISVKDHDLLIRSFIERYEDLYLERCSVLKFSTNLE